ncbi:MAG: response regulator, partial [Nitrospirae bacterium]
MREKILIIDDEEDILELLRYNFSKEGYTTLCVSTGEEGLRLATTEQPDLVVLDLMLPGLDGMEVCRQLKSNIDTRQIPIIMLTAKGEEADIVAGLEIGADDYVTKPFSPKVLIARVRATLRAKKSDEVRGEKIIKINNIVIDPIR